MSRFKPETLDKIIKGEIDSREVLELISRICYFFRKTNYIPLLLLILLSLISLI